MVIATAEGGVTDRKKGTAEEQSPWLRQAASSYFCCHLFPCCWVTLLPCLALLLVDPPCEMTVHVSVKWSEMLVVSVLCTQHQTITHWGSGEALGTWHRIKQRKSTVFNFMYLFVLIYSKARISSDGKPVAAFPTLPWLIYANPCSEFSSLL